MEPLENASSDDSAGKITRLMVWFEKLGGILHHNIAITAQGNGRGFRLTFMQSSTASSSSAEEVVVSTPHVSAFSVLQLPIVAPWYPCAWIDSLDTTTLTRFMLIEAYLRGTMSTFHPYISMLPQPDTDSPFNTPLYWSEAERAIIKGTNLYEATFHRERVWETEFEQAKAALQTLVPAKKDHVASYTFELYKWAATVLSSRCFPHWMIQPDNSERDLGSTVGDENEFAQSRIHRAWLSREPALSFPVLLPVLDLANHSPNAQVTWKSGRASAQILASTHQHEVGGEFLNNYGQKANDELILGYGFDLSPNDVNSVLLSLDIAASPKVQYVRRLVEQSLSSTAPPALPQILSPSTSFAKSPFLYALRDRQDPLTSAASTPLSFMAMNTRELRNRTTSPFSIPIFDSDREPTRHAVATLLPFAWKLHAYRTKIHISSGEAVTTKDIDSTYNMQMALRSRGSQLTIVDNGLVLLKKTMAAWQASESLVEITDLLTSITPVTILKKFRHLVRHTLGTRDEEKLAAQGLQEAVFVLWIVNLVKELGQHAHDAYPVGDPTHDNNGANTTAMSHTQLHAWLTKMKVAYGDVATGPDHSHLSSSTTTAPANNDADMICWSEDDHKDAEDIAATYVSRIVQSEVMEDTESLKHEVLWAVRVVREEGLWIPDWLDVASDDDAHRDELTLVMVLQEPDAFDA